MARGQGSTVMGRGRELSAPQPGRPGAEACRPGTCQHSQHAWKGLRTLPHRTTLPPWRPAGQDGAALLVFPSARAAAARGAGVGAEGPHHLAPAGVPAPPSWRCRAYGAQAGQLVPSRAVLGCPNVCPIPPRARPRNAQAAHALPRPTLSTHRLCSTCPTTAATAEQGSGRAALAGCDIRRGVLASVQLLQHRHRQ